MAQSSVKLVYALFLVLCDSSLSFFLLCLLQLLFPCLPPVLPPDLLPRLLLLSSSISSPCHSSCLICSLKPLRENIEKMQADRRPHFVAEKFYLVKKGEWVRQKGYIPLTEERPLKVHAFLTQRNQVEEWFGVAKERCLSSKERK